ncbi:hypothetical protein DPX16_21252 [Anabarilius grahami]|uniref:Uncharacterized protein n=1 Tax=Anabarilius grahami TaxID=495550 RepID=A0A3N0YF37_ANAGA|nr:hypothetical protein DPX16_21252 [Anabarilius grahami]
MDTTHPLSVEFKRLPSGRRYRYPKLTAEFQRITTVQLEPKFMSSLDLHIPKLLKLFRAKGGALGQRLKTEMELLKVTDHGFSSPQGSSLASG